jgi:uncharacterized protein YndB with AHSA1/START domain
MLARAETPANDTLVVERVFAAPAALVFTLWSSAEHMARWWGPRRFSIAKCEVDFREGGAWRVNMLGPDGRQYPASGRYREISPPTRLVFTFGWDNPDEDDRQTVVTVSFREDAGKTHMRFHQTPFASIEHRDGHGAGWSECFERLEAYLIISQTNARLAAPKIR